MTSTKQPPTKSEFSGLNIDKIVSGINADKLTPTPPSATQSAAQTPSATQTKEGAAEEPKLSEQPAAEVAEDNAPTDTKPDVVWQDFLTFCEKPSKAKGKEIKQIPVPIDEDILNILRICSFGKLSQKGKVNAILRSFIINHKEELKQHLELKNTLI